MEQLVRNWEQSLILQAQAGNSSAFAALTEPRRTQLLRHAIGILRNSQDANDAVQETLIRSYRALKQLDPSRPLFPWLKRICSNVCLDMMRARREHEDLESIEFALADEVNESDDHAEAQMLLAAVQQALAELPDRYQIVARLRFFDELEITEICLVVHKPEGTVKCWLHRARELLKQDPRVQSILAA